MISVVIFSGVILVLAGMTFTVAERTTRASDQAYVMSYILAEVDRMAMLPFDSLIAAGGCRTNTTGPVTLNRCTDVYTMTSRIDSIRIRAWTNIPGGRPDTVGFRRAKLRLPVPIR